MNWVHYLVVGFESPKSMIDSLLNSSVGMVLIGN